MRRWELEQRVSTGSRAGWWLQSRSHDPWLVLFGCHQSPDTEKTNQALDDVWNQQGRGLNLIMSMISSYAIGAWTAHLSVHRSHATSIQVAQVAHRVHILVAHNARVRLPPQTSSPTASRINMGRHSSNGKEQSSANGGETRKLNYRKSVFAQLEVAHFTNLGILVPPSTVRAMHYECVKSGLNCIYINLLICDNLFTRVLQACCKNWTIWQHPLWTWTVRLLIQLRTIILIIS